MKLLTPIALSLAAAILAPPVLAQGEGRFADRQLDSAFKWAADHSEQIVKTGYVTDAGQIERVNADISQHREWLRASGW